MHHKIFGQIWPFALSSLVAHKSILILRRKLFFMFQLKLEMFIIHRFFWLMHLFSMHPFSPSRFSDVFRE